MGNRVVMQVVGAFGEFGPVVYSHWNGSKKHEFVAQLKAQMKNRTGDVAYASARLVQIVCGDDTGCTGFGIWNTDHTLTSADSHGDNGVVLIDCADFSATYFD